MPLKDTLTSLSKLLPRLDKLADDMFAVQVNVENLSEQNRSIAQELLGHSERIKQVEKRIKQVEKKVEHHT